MVKNYKEIEQKKILFKAVLMVVVSLIPGRYEAVMPNTGFYKFKTKKNII